ncbi:MAG: hypothetical protein RI894_2077 [Bacteroidota bacterium]
MRILAIDYGSKRTGLAVTDPLRIIATALDTVATPDIFDYLSGYLQREPVSTIVVGEPLNTDGTPAHTAEMVAEFVAKIRLLFPSVEIDTYDERFTSIIAKKRMLSMGLKKKDRRDKGLIDKISAVIILEDYLMFKGIF